MTGLEDTFGSDFANQVEEKIQERRAERQKVGEEVKRKVAHLAVNEGKFDEGDPIFSYTSDSGMTHDVMLMKLAEPNEGTVWNQINELESGAVSVPLDYLGEWIWSIFNDRDMLKDMDEGEWYLIIGNMDQWEDDSGDLHDQLSPVRGVLSMEETQQLADEALEDEGFDESAVSDSGTVEESDTDRDDDSPFGGSDDDEEPEEDEEDEEESDDDSGGLFGGSGEGDDEEEEEDDTEEDKFPAQSEVDEIVEALGEEEPEMWELDKVKQEKETVMMVVGDKLDLDWNNDDEVAEDMWEKVLDRVEREQEEEEDEEDDEEDALF